MPEEREVVVAVVADAAEEVETEAEVEGVE